MQFRASLAVLVGGAVALSLVIGRGKAVADRVRHAVGMTVVACLSIIPLNWTLADWHGDIEAFYELALTVASFPLSIPAWAVLTRFNSVGALPFLGGDAVFGRFSGALAANLVVLGMLAYAQWGLVVPWLMARTGSRKS